MTARTSTDAPARPIEPTSGTTIHDVVIVGAGLSGIGAACHLTRERPGTDYVVLESRPNLGGTWDLFRYPGIRSDSDMYTLGYAFRPWRDRRAIADGQSILDYLRDTAVEYGVTDHIRYGHRVVSAAWDTAAGVWTVTAETTDPDTGRTRQLHLRTRWLSVCAGYYRYDRGHRPTFAGEDTFGGTIVSPQHWPEDLDWVGKRVTVIGSGATAVTLVPTLAADAAHVTMLQRTPSFIVSLPGSDPLARLLERTPLPTSLTSRIMFWKNVIGNVLSYETARRLPRLARWLIQRGIAAELKDPHAVARHFDPPYDPWDQRVCVVPDGDLFVALREGRAEVVTDTIARFTEHGIETASGRIVDSEIVVAATGLHMVPLGGMTISVNGIPVSLPDTYVYKGMMLSGVPNFNLVIGYTNNSWTLKADLVNRAVARLLVHLDREGLDTVVPTAVGDLGSRPLVDLHSGYVRRAVSTFPIQGDRAPWRLHQNYLLDIGLFGGSVATDPALTFGRTPSPTTTGPRVIDHRGGIHA